MPSGAGRGGVVLLGIVECNNSSKVQGRGFHRLDGESGGSSHVCFTKWVKAGGPCEPPRREGYVVIRL